MARESSARGARGGQCRRARNVPRGRAPAEQLAFGRRLCSWACGRGGGARGRSRARAFHCAHTARGAPAARAVGGGGEQGSAGAAEGETTGASGPHAAHSRRSRADRRRPAARAAHAAVASSREHIFKILFDFYLPQHLSSVVSLRIGGVTASIAGADVPGGASRA